MDPRLSASLEGRYTIDREIGRGGMATVYLARDIRHNRNVALKVLNPELGAILGVERFLAEIQVTANLQHPNLLPLFDSGEANGLLFYVMPFVEGESLRAKLDREKQLPVDEAVRIAVSIANALEYAHQHKVIHRDLKPENILMQSGQAVIADFGIALAVSNAGGARITQTGLSLGTPQYMSPEQATGDRVVDGRTDIYSLGAITYEMLVGDAPHHASTAQAIIAKVMTEKPQSVRVGRPNVPEHVDAAVIRSLEKLAADRFGTANEFADALQGKGATGVTAARPARASARVGIGGREIAAWAVVVIIAAAFAWSKLDAPRPAEAPVVRAVLDMSAGTTVDPTLPGSGIAISPSGDAIAYNARVLGGGSQGFIRRSDALVAHPIAGPAGQGISTRNMVFSPDGRYVAFTEGNVLSKVLVEGGSATTLTAELSTSSPYGLAWAPNGTIYIGGFSGLFAVPSSGGKVTPIGAGGNIFFRQGARWPLALSDGKTLLLVAARGSSDIPRLAVYNIPRDSATVLDLQVASILGVFDDKLVYVAPDGIIMTVRFDPRTKRPAGQSTPLEEGILVDLTVGAKAALSASGTLAYLSGRAEQQVVTLRRESSVAVPLLRETRVFANPRFSPDGNRMAITVITTGSSDIWVYNIPGHTFERLTTEGMNTRPEWTPDGKKVVFRSERAGKVGIWWQPVDGSGPAELLYGPPVEPFEAIISPDSQWIVFRTAPGSEYPRDILAVPMKGERKILPLATGPATESMPRLSPNGKWLAYQGSGSGKFQIYVRPFPNSGGLRQVSVDGGSEPVWSRNGKELLYRDPNGAIVSVAVTTGAEFSIGERKQIVSGDYGSDASHASYDVAPNGDLLLLRRAGADSRTIIVHNWIREFREKTATMKRP